MSFTLTHNSERTAINATTIYLSPSKRVSEHHEHEPLRTKHTPHEIFSWTLHAKAVATCSIQDVQQMAAQIDVIDNKKCDFYWLGHVPCRSVKLVGMVVGIREYERRIVYTVDDGTAVLECAHPYIQQAPKSKYEPSEKLEPPPPPKPLANIGQIVAVTGRIKATFERSIVVDLIAACSSPNDELVHMRKVRELHETLYSKTEPFVIPISTQVPPPPVPSPTKRVAFNKTTVAPSSPPSSVSTSPIKAPPEYSSPIKPGKPTIKLRHPSRLHTHDLTANTFRIYVKHYVDRIQETQTSAYESDASLTECISRVPSTPTKSSRPNFNETPRQSSCHDAHATPRPRIPALNFTTKASNSTDTSRSIAILPSSQSKQRVQQGFTLSYLRRVPELRLLASRVVEAVNRRHLRQEKKKLQVAGVQLSSTQRRPTSSTTAMSATQLASKMKRLFEWAIIQLLQEGCIVIWDGPIHSCPDTSIATTSQLWRSNTSASTVGGDSTIFSTTLGSMPSFWGEDDDLSGALSDPDPDEEAYIALTPEYLADFVENAIKVLVAHYQTIGKPYAGATKDGILSVLKKDDRWRFLGTWTIDDALKELQLDGRVWDMGSGRWDLTE